MRAKLSAMMHLMPFNYHGSMLTGRAAAEIFSRHHDLIFFHIGGKGGINIFHGMFCQFFEIRNIQITGRNDYIRIHMIPVTPDLAHPNTSSAEAI